LLGWGWPPGDEALGRSRSAPAAHRWESRMPHAAGRAEWGTPGGERTQALMTASHLSSREGQERPSGCGEGREWGFFLFFT
jgi:hypothetical protein